MYLLRIKQPVRNKRLLSNSNLSDAEIEQMKADAEAHKAEDEAKAEKMNKINMAQIILNGCDQALNDENLKDKITQEDRDNIMPLKENLDKLLKEYQTAEDKEKAFNDILTAQKSLEDAWNPVMQKIYAQSNPQGQQANPFGAGGSNPFGDMFNGAQTQQ